MNSSTGNTLCVFGPHELIDLEQSTQLISGRGPSAAELGPGKVIAERYRLENCLGKGAFGDVYEAFDTCSETKVALKVLTATNEAMGWRFRRGMALARNLKHPNLVATRRLGQGRGYCYVVMDLPRKAQDLSSTLDLEGRLPWQEAVSLALDLLAALDYLDRRGLVHRDVKPSNVLCIERRGRRHGVLIDFDLLRTWDKSRSCDSGIWDAAALTVEDSGSAGTPMFMSLDRIQGAAASPADDTFAAALILYKMLTGQMPTDGPDAPRTLRELELARLRPCPPLDDLIPAEVQRVLERALAPHRQQRYPTAGKLARALSKAAHAAGYSFGRNTTVILRRSQLDLPARQAS